MSHIPTRFPLRRDQHHREEAAAEVNGDGDHDDEDGDEDDDEDGDHSLHVHTRLAQAEGSWEAASEKMTRE